MKVWGLRGARAARAKPLFWKTLGRKKELIRLRWSMWSHAVVHAVVCVFVCASVCVLLSMLLSVVCLCFCLCVVSVLVVFCVGSPYGSEAFRFSCCVGPYPCARARPPCL